jgi:RHS repeat-associated protein
MNRWAAGAAVPTDAGSTAPKAYLQYILFNKNMSMAQHGHHMVSEEAGSSWQHLQLRVPIEEIGYIYIYVINESMDGVDVYFDDAEVQLIDAPLTSASDYYPYGLPICYRSYSSEHYRYGYQGQFAEKDEETGWNAFELRMYEPVVGRWIVPDPMRQYFSPYLAMGNNPVFGVDPDGGEAENPDSQFDPLYPDLFKGLSGPTSDFAIILDEVMVEPTVGNYISDVVYLWAEINEVTVYGNFMLKGSRKKGEGKVTVPIIGVSASYSSKGRLIKPITPASSYIGYVYKGQEIVEIRYYPALGEGVPGEDAQIRALIMVHPVPVKYKDFKGKAQLDFLLDRTGGLPRAGGRVVGEINIAPSFSVEGSVGVTFRIHPFMLPNLLLFKGNQLLWKSILLF